MLWCVVLSKRSGKPRRLALSAAAKVNLALEVLGRRDDGYHEIATVMQAVDLSDKLVLEDADVLELRTTASGVPTDGTNLALKAAMTLREMAGVILTPRLTPAISRRVTAAFNARLVPSVGTPEAVVRSSRTSASSSTSLSDRSTACMTVATSW